MVKKGLFSAQDVDETVLRCGYHIEFATMDHNSPVHRHRAMEILYILNGYGIVGMNGRKYRLNPLDIIVIDSYHAHDVLYGMPQSMGICIHVSKSYMRSYLPDIQLRKIDCINDTAQEKNAEAYQKICEHMKALTVTYMESKHSYELRCNGLVLGILAELVDHFSSPVTESMPLSYLTRLSRMDHICSFVEKNYQSGITLQTAADEVGLNKDYFCRFFKENMGISFMNYVSQVRISHIYQELLHSEKSIQEIVEGNGFLNQKLFYRKFKEMYHCTPRELRKIAEKNPYL